MSGKPYPEGVKDVVALLKKRQDLYDEQELLVVHQKRLDEVRGELSNVNDGILRNLRAMDLDSPGNWGWEQRMAWFLGEMNRQVSK